VPNGGQGARIEGKKGIGGKNRHHEVFRDLAGYGVGRTVHS
jgi:hypothetical protein